MIILGVLVAVVAVVYIYFKKCHQFWSEQGVEQPPSNFIFGSVGSLILQRSSYRDLIYYLYEFTTKRYLGFYAITEPIFFVRDPNLIKQITIENFENFEDSKMLESEMPFKGLLNLKGNVWKYRGEVSPDITASNMKYMYNSVEETTKRLMDYILNRSRLNSTNVELTNLCNRLTTDLITSTTLGLTPESLQEENKDLDEMTKKLMNFNFMKQLQYFLHLIAPKLFKDNSEFSEESNQYLRNIIKESIRNREKQGAQRNDIIQILIEARNSILRNAKNCDSGLENGLQKEKSFNKTYLTDEEIVEQCLIFLFAGKEILSTAISFMLYEVATNPDVQDKLHEEIKEAHKKSNEVSYEEICNLQYSNLVVLETLRKWPPVNALHRKCTKSFTIDPIEEGESRITIQKGQTIWLAVSPLQNDPKYYPQPELFKPERFSDGKGQSELFLSFGLGPRSSIGYKYAMLAMQLILFKILSKFELVMTNKTIVPLEIRQGQFTANSRRMFVGFKPKNEKA